MEMEVKIVKINMAPNIGIKLGWIDNNVNTSN